MTDISAVIIMIINFVSLGTIVIPLRVLTWLLNNSFTLLSISWIFNYIFFCSFFNSIFTSSFELSSSISVCLDVSSRPVDSLLVTAELKVAFPFSSVEFSAKFSSGVLPATSFSSSSFELSSSSSVCSDILLGTFDSSKLICRLDQSTANCLNLVGLSHWILVFNYFPVLNSVNCDL